MHIVPKLPYFEEQHQMLQNYDVFNKKKKYSKTSSNFVNNIKCSKSVHDFLKQFHCARFSLKIDSRANWLYFQSEGKL